MHVTSMDSWSRKLTRARYILYLQFFFIGAEFSIFLPTLPFYLKELNTPNIPVFFGIIHGAFLFCGMITSLWLGRLADNTLRFRRIVVAVNGITLLGNAIYCVGYSPYVLIAARFFGGAIDAMFPITYGEYGRCYSKDEMRRQASYLMTACGLGICMGPVFNLLPKLKKLDLELLSIRYTNAPGAFIFCAYLLMFFLSLFGLSDLSRERQILSYCGKENTNNSFIARSKDAKKYTFESKESKSNGNINNSEDEAKLAKNSFRRSPTECWWQYVIKFLKRNDILILVYGQIVWSYTLVTGDGLLPLVATQLLNLSLQSVACIYLASGLVFVGTLLGGTRLQSRFSVVTVSLSGFVLSFTAFAFLLLTAIAQHLDSWVLILLFVVYSISFSLGFCLNSIALKTIVSNRVAPENQSFSQGIFSAAQYMSSVGAALTLGISFRYLIDFCIIVVILNLIAIIVFARYYDWLCDPVWNTGE